MLPLVVAPAQFAANQAHPVNALALISMLLVMASGVVSQV